MIVLKATQDKVLAVLQSVSGICERRHTLPILANVLGGKNSISNGFPEQGGGGAATAEAEASDCSGGEGAPEVAASDDDDGDGDGDPDSDHEAAHVLKLHTHHSRLRFSRLSLSRTTSVLAVVASIS